MDHEAAFIATPDSPTGAPPDTEPPVIVEVEADPTLGYASIQNAVPILRSLSIANRSADTLRDIELRLACNPPFAESIRLRFERLAPGETRRIAPLDLRPDHAFLADLPEAVRASIEIDVLANGVEVARASRPVEVLAYDLWAGTRALPELLAAFCMPNNPAVDMLLGKASALLRSAHSELSIDGYQSKSRDAVWKQISAIYSTVAAEDLQYAEPPASFGDDGQKIRTPDRVLAGRVATCLDLAMLFASAFEQAGLRPVVLLKESHAWVGVWLHEACFADPLTDDVQAVRKRVDTGEFLVFETTSVAHHHSRRPSLRVAMEQGLGHLREENTFRYAIDIRRARELQIKPLPSRVAPPAADGAHDPLVEAPPAAIEPTPFLPELAVDATRLPDPADDTPDGRLAKWKSRLLDLTLRNRLLNFKPTKASLQLVAPDLARLEDALAEGREFRLRPLPALMEGLDPRVAQVHASRGTGRTPLDDMALEALGGGELLTRVAQDALDGHLLAIHTAARIGLEEGGANTLYLALGLLQWAEADKADAVHRAPILLIPVTLQRQSVRAGFRLVRHDDEAIVNPTLLQLLRTGFELRVAGLDVVPTDDRGIDVARVLQAFRLAVAEIPKWEVLDQAHLGIFSFTKYLMWKDLQDRTEDLKANRVVRHLIDKPGQAFAREDDAIDFERLDETYRPQDILAPLLADSSQLKAICAIDAGRDLVLEGPPGTGKSQTITNLIAHSLGSGKTVLFVSEKLAALSVVHRRLNDIGLGPFCLELHSSKSKKSEVLQQLASSLDMAGQRTADDWNREAERLTVLRQQLNGLVQALHRPYPNGLTVHEAIGTCIGQAGVQPASMPWTDPLAHGRDELDRMRETARRIQALAGAIGALQTHPLRLVGKADWSIGWSDDLLVAMHELDRTAGVLSDAVANLDAQVGIGNDGASMDAFDRLDRLADVLLGAPKVPQGLARQAHDPVARARVQALARHGTTRNAAWQRMGPGWTPQVAGMNATALMAEWSGAEAAWWPKSALARRAFTGRLTGFRADGKRPTAIQIRQMLVPLSEVNAADLALRAAEAEATVLLDEAFAGIDTDWSALLGHEAWAGNFAEAVARFADGDTAQAAALRSTLQPLVAENRAALAPSGAAGRALLGYRDAWRSLRKALAVVDALALPVAPLQGPAHDDGSLSRIRHTLGEWLGARHVLQPWCRWRNVREVAVAQGLQALVVAVEAGRTPLADVETYFEFSYRSWWVKRTIDGDPVLRDFSSADHERKIREFRSADERFQKLTERYIAATLAGRVPASSEAAVSADSELGRLRRERQKQRGHMPVRQLVRSLPTLLPKLKPCLLMSPLSVSQYLDAGYAQFDLVVFDEASQIPVWDAVGVIARGRQLAVVGDPKQLPPTSFFSRSSDPDENGSGDPQVEVEDLESILDECLGAGMNRMSLKWHYRSRHESLITFSNVTYYGSELVTFPSPVTDDTAVRFERVAGVYDRGGSRTNRAEADAIVQGIEAHYLDPAKARLTLGVVTFNHTQQALIETLLDARRRASPELDRAIEARAHEKLFIKNLENVQGDERDVIFFSITYGPDAGGKVTMNFGPLNGEGGHRRLNVAISRAREAVVIYSTLMPDQIDLARVRAAGVRDLKHYLEFAIGGARAMARRNVPTGLDPDSPFEVAVIDRLRSRGWVVHPQVGCSGYRIDLAVVDPRAPGRYLVGIECDGRAYHSGASARDRDRLRQHVLEGLGWRIHRIWSTDWWLNPQGEVDKMVALLDSLMGAGEPAAEAGGARPAESGRFEMPA
jgi:very-short-patch-repair endonuclease